MKAEDWLPVLPGQEDLFWRSPGGAYWAQYNLPSNAVTFGGDRTMAWEYGPSGHISLEQVKSWLARLEQACIPPPDTIEFVNAYSTVVKMVRRPYEKRILTIGQQRNLPLHFYHHHLVLMLL